MYLLNCLFSSLESKERYLHVGRGYIFMHVLIQQILMDCLLCQLLGDPGYSGDTMTMKTSPVPALMESGVYWVRQMLIKYK